MKSQAKFGVRELSKALDLAGTILCRQIYGPRGSLLFLLDSFVPCLPILTYASAIYVH